MFLRYFVWIFVFFFAILSGFNWISHSATESLSVSALASVTPSLDQQFLKLSDQAIKNSKIRLATAGPAHLQKVLHLPGQIAVDQHLQQAVAARFSGVVVYLPRHVGQWVQKGDLLAVLESRELADLRLSAQQSNQEWQQTERRLQRDQELLQQVKHLVQLLRSGKDPHWIHQKALTLPMGSPKAELLSAFSELRLSRENAQRTQLAEQSKLASQQELSEAQDRLRQAEANYAAVLEEMLRQHDNSRQERRLQNELAHSAHQAAQQKLQALGVQMSSGALTRYEIRSPRSGTLIEKRVNEGESINAESTLYLIADLSHVWAEMQIYANDLKNIKLGMPVKMWSEDRSLNSVGQVNHLKPIVDPVSRTAEAHAEIPNPKGKWFPGMYISLELIQSQTTVPVAIERTAIQSISGKNRVFVHTKKGFIARTVELGEDDGQKVAIRQGLKAGEHYAASQSFVLKSALLGQAEE